MGIKIRQTGKWLALGFVLCVVGTAHAQVYYVGRVIPSTLSPPGAKQPQTNL